MEKDDNLKQNIFQIGNTGYKQIWSNRVYIIESIDGVRATLDNKEVVKLKDGTDLVFPIHILTKISISLLLRFLTDFSKIF